MCKKNRAIVWEVLKIIESHDGNDNLPWVLRNLDMQKFW